MRAKNKPLAYGILSGIALLLFYFLIMIITSSYSNAIGQFFDMWYLFLALIIGFGMQISLYTYVRNWHLMNNEIKSSIVASTGISTTSMIACCAHHLTDVLPVIGFSAAALFLSKYQNVFLFIGVISNIFGVILMLRVIKDKKLYSKRNKLISFFTRYNLDLLLNVVIILSIIILPFLILKYSGGLK